LQAFVRSTVHLGFWPTLCGVIGLAIVGRPVLGLFDPAFAAAYPALMVLALGWLVKAAAGPVEYLLNAGGDQRAAGGIYLGGALVNAALTLVLIPPFGLLGAAAATSLSIALVTALLAGRAKRRMGISSTLVPGPAAAAQT
jgi:O-antigen/teichoic acid export membrane protein